MSYTANLPVSFRGGVSEGVSTHARITLLCLAALTIMSGATVAPALPALQLHFSDVPNSELLSRLVVSLPALSIALCAPVAGIVSDRYGRLRLLLASLLLYGLSGIFALLQENLIGILASRLFLGVAVAGTMTSVTALVGDYFDRQQRLNHMSQQSAFISIGGVVFLTLGGLLADIHWRAPFAIYAMALLLIPTVVLFLWEPHRPHHAKQRVHIAEKPGNQLPFSVLLAAATLNSLAFYIIPTQLPFYLKNLGISTPSLIATAIAASNVMGAIASLLLYRRVGNLLGTLGVFIASFVIMAAGFTLIAISNTLAGVIIATSIYGLGMGTLIPHIFSTGLESAPESRRGRTAGILTAGIFIGQFISPLISQPWIQKFGFSSAFMSVAMVLLFAAMIGVMGQLLKNRNNH
ncbi:MFS transporter [Microbulbifer sp. OS29]|uniref:MFS transporter n=1 Tax=Microbulbifer okhotskensis TaxID=2926617 RepID=A0A9X2EPX9_9GAMM|nr:MFS transporter [Microbulbifer okhotskensis]MCO1335605.1 MFS transporter [Microbulbifer okhotskensis]